MAPIERINHRFAPSFREAMIARAQELVAAGERFGPLDLPGTHIALGVYVGCMPSKLTLASVAPIGSIDGQEVWVGFGDPVEDP